MNSSINNLKALIQTHSIGVLTKIPNSRSHSNTLYIQSFQYEATNHGADGCVFLAEYNDGSFVWGPSSLSLNEFLSANLNHQIVIAPSDYSVISSLLKSMNSTSPTITLFITKNTQKLIQSTSHIPFYPDVETTYQRYLKSPHFSSFTSATQTSFIHLMNNFVFTTSNKKIDLSLLLNSKTLSTRGLTNYLTTLETITGIQNRKIPKLKKIVKSNPAYHPNGFTQQPVGVEINWTHSELQTIAA